MMLAKSGCWFFVGRTFFCVSSDGVCPADGIRKVGSLQQLDLICGKGADRTNVIRWTCSLLCGGIHWK